MERDSSRGLALAGHEGDFLPARLPSDLIKSLFKVAQDLQVGRLKLGHLVLFQTKSLLTAHLLKSILRARLAGNTPG